MPAIPESTITAPAEALRLWATLAVAVLIAALVASLTPATVAPTTATRSIPVVSGKVLPQVEVPRLLDIPPQTALLLNAAQPFVTLHPAKASPFRFDGSVEDRGRAVDCLAAAAWYEAGDDPSGQRSVVQVVLNRARHPAFPATVCGVVFQGSERVTGCQFSFTCDGSLRRSPSAEAWDRARAIASAALDGVVDPRVGYATHYHTDWVVPYWRASLDKIAQVRTHLFYRWPGFWGKPGAFRSDAGQGEPIELKLARLSPAHLAPGAEIPPTGLAAADALDLATAAPRPVPAALSISGVPEKSLRKAVVRGQTPDSGRFFIEVHPQTFPGSYATAAVALCRDKPSCTVLGWRDAGRMGVGLPLAPAERTSLTFFYAKDAAGDRALWNCGQVQRSNKGQCLPDEESRLAQLVG